MNKRFVKGERVIVAPDPRMNGMQPFEGTVDQSTTSVSAVIYVAPDDHPQNPDGTEPIEISLKHVSRIPVPATKMPVRHNHKPTARELEVRRAIHVLTDELELAGEEVSGNLILAQVDELGLYLVVSILNDSEDDELPDGTTEARPNGTIQYQLSDGLPGGRSHSLNFYHLKDAVTEFDAIVKAGGWRERSAQLNAAK
jgi:hypothetical protein